jgi:hypothetical protein
MAINHGSAQQRLYAFIALTLEIAFISPAIAYVAYVVLMAALVLDVATYWRMFRGFGKGTLFCVLGVIFQPMAIAICAFDGSDYCG